MRVVDLLVNRIGYAVVSQIKTLQFTKWDDTVQSKMIVQLKKSKDFGKLYDEFQAKKEAQFKARHQAEEAKAGVTSTPPKQTKVQEEEVKACGTPPTINSCAGTVEEGSGTAGAGTSSSKSDLEEEGADEEGEIHHDVTSSPKEGTERPLQVDKWWLKGLSKEDIDQLVKIGADPNEEPLLFE